MYRIYALLDPRTLAVRYVGLTYHPLATRVRAHMSESALRESNPRAEWLRGLRDAELVPLAVELEATDDGREAHALEIGWIRRAQSAGVDLTNSRHFREVSEATRRKQSQAAYAFYARQHGGRDGAQS